MQVFSDISIWWLIPIGIIAFLVSFIFYRNQKQIKDVSTFKKWLLISLRTSSLFLIGLFLLGLIVEHKDYKTEKPIFISLIDDSSSMLNYKDSNSVSNSIESFQNEVKEKYKDRFDFHDILIGDEVSSGKASFNNGESNLEKGFNHIYNLFYNRNIGGICFISDGNFTSGINPIYTAEKISLTPVFTVGVGDTLVKRDQFIRNVAVNNIAFFKNSFPIEVDIEAHKMISGSSKVSIWRNGKKIKEQKIEFKDGYLDFNHVSFEVEANQIGFVEFTVKVENKENEVSYVNNMKRFYVEVIDSRNKILILADAPHPDLTVLRQELITDENIEVDSKLVSEWDGTLEDYALVILHNPSALNGALVDKISNSPVSSLYFITGHTSSSIVSNLKLGLSYPNGNRTDEVQASINSGFQLFEISDELKTELKKWPPLTVKFGSIKSNNGSVLINQQIGPVTKEDPILYFGKRRNNKFGVFIGEGLWKWKLSEYSRTKSNVRFNEFIQKVVQYLTVKKNSDPLRINLPNRFTTGDEISINAEFYNSSFEPITEPTISLVLTDEEGSKINYEFAKNTKDYLLSLGRLDEGMYIWKASTKFNGKSYSKNGTFIVDDISIESMSSHANHNLLQQIASKTNGQFYTLNNINLLYKELDTRKDIVNVTHEESAFDDLIDWKWLFILLITLLGAEWFIRRFNGTY